MGNLSERRKDDVPFIGSDDMYYETESGKVFDLTEDTPYRCFDDWYNELRGYSYRSEWIHNDIDIKDHDAALEWLKQAFQVGYLLGKKDGNNEMREQMHHLLKHSIMD